MTDVIIIGAGPAGMTAAIYAVRSGLKTIIFEGSLYGGQIINTPEIENYPSVSKISGMELAQNMYDQVKNIGADIRFEAVTGISDNGSTKTVVTDNQTYETKTVIIANGAKHRKLDIDGEEQFSGKGVSYCATCDGSFFAGKTAVVIGGGNTALEDAIYLSNICEKVYIVHRRDEFRGEQTLVNTINSKDNIEKLMGYIPVKINGENFVEALVLKNVQSTEEKILKTDAVFVSVGMAPDNGLFLNIIEVNESGYIIAGEDCKTSAPGIYAAGDTRTKTLRQIVTATADGANAASEALAYINSLK